jgi:hypothetical protein
VTGTQHRFHNLKPEITSGPNKNYEDRNQNSSLILKIKATSANEKQIMKYNLRSVSHLTFNIIIRRSLQRLIQEVHGMIFDIFNRAVSSILMTLFPVSDTGHISAVATRTLNTQHLRSALAVPWLRSLIAGLSPRRPGFAPGSINVGFVVDKVALGQAFLRVLRFSPVNIIPPSLSKLMSSGECVIC